MNIKKYFSIIMAAVIICTGFTGCKKETASSTGANIIENQDGGVDVQIDERTEETKYQYDTDDLSFIDTQTGKSVDIGMSKTDVEAITGEPIRKDGSSRVYNGITVQYDNEERVVGIIISGGQFKEKEVRYRFKTSRGVCLDTSFEDFSKAYGDAANEAAESQTAEDGTVTNAGAAKTAVRYFEASGNKVKYIDTKKTEEVKKVASDKLYMQYFMFDDETNCVSAIRVTRDDFVGK